MILKTYGTESLVDWKAQINIGKAKMIVHFSGGAITRYGVTPAEYSTADPMMQHVIERSSYYKSGRIKLLRTAEVADDAATKARKARETKRAMRKVAEEADVVEEQTKVNIETQETNLPDMEAQSTVDEIEDEAEPAPASEDEPAGLKEVEVTCVQDAQQYLTEHFNIPAYKVRTKASIQEAGATHGIEFKWI